MGRKAGSFEFFFALDGIKRMAPQHPEWKDREPYESVLANDMAGIEAAGMNGIGEIMVATHTA